MRLSLLSLSFLLACCGGRAPSKPNNADEVMWPVTDVVDSQTIPDIPRPRPDLAADIPADTPAIQDVAPDLFCQPGHPVCLDDKTRGICDDSGAEYKAVDCDEGLICDDGFCLEVVCIAGAAKGECAGPSTVYVCSEKGTAWVAKECETGLTCYEGQCVNWQCNPGDMTCKGLTAVQECLPDGEGGYSWVVVETCEGGMCMGGKCVSACEANIKMNSYLGCDYWAVDLDNIEGGEHEAVAVVVSAPGNGNAAKVTITSTSTGMELTPEELGGAPLTVPPGGVQVYLLPNFHDLDGSVLTDKTFEVVTNSPVTVHQFNPLNGEEIFTNDASLLLPAHAGGKEYVVMAWPMRTWGGVTLRSFLTVIATQEGDTEVEVAPASPVVAGQGVPAMGKWQSQKFFLKRGDVLNLENEGVEGDDLTGTIILADKKVSVFGGHECANIHIPWERCDHIEQQLFPVQAWGKEYVGDPFYPRNNMQEDTWRIVAGENNIQVTLDPPIAGPYSLSKGEWVQFDAETGFVATGTGKFLLGHYLQSCNYPGFTVACSDISGQLGIGDPAFTLGVPVGQYLDQYVLLTPEDYDEDYINFISKPETGITLDGVLLTDQKVSVGFGEWTVIQKKVNPGIHSVEADGPVGLTAYGYGCHVSYAYPGGLKLEAF